MGFFQKPYIFLNLGQGTQIIEMGTFSHFHKKGEGEQKHILYAKKDYLYNLENSSEMNCPVFFVKQKSKIFAILWNSFIPFRITLKYEDLGNNIPNIYMKPVLQDKIVDFDFFILEGTLPEITNNISFLLGYSFLPPIWALGHHSYFPKAKGPKSVLKKINELKAKNIPCDAVYFNAKQTQSKNSLIWNKIYSKYSMEWITRMQELKIRKVLMIEPYILKNKKNPRLQEGLQSQMFCDFQKSFTRIPAQKYQKSKYFLPDLTKGQSFHWWAKQQADFLRKRYRWSMEFNLF